MGHSAHVRKARPAGKWATLMISNQSEDEFTFQQQDFWQNKATARRNRQQRTCALTRGKSSFSARPFWE